MANTQSILLVEDNEDLRSMIALRLEGSGYNVHEAEDAVQALQINRNNRGIDLVLCDLNLPGISGFDMFRVIRESGYSMPFVLMTGAFLKKEDVLAIGINDFIQKPFRMGELEDCIARCLPQSAHRDAQTG